MRTDVKIDLSKLLDDTQNLRYKKDFGIRNPYLHDENNKKGLSLVRVEDEDAKFLSLYGLFINIDNGDIALGLFPDPNDYYCVGNIHYLLAKKMFDSDKIPKFVDTKFIIESLKIGSTSIGNSIYEAVVSDYNDNGCEDIKYNSIIMNIAHQWNKENRIPEELKGFDRLRSGDRYIHSIMESCLQVLKSLEKTAVNYCGAFITEANVEEVLSSLTSSVKIADLLECGEPNLERLAVVYMSYGIPLDFILAMKSYGLGIKQRKMIYKLIDGNASNKVKFARYMDLLSSLQYLNEREVSSKIDTTKVTCFNIIDLIRSIGRENDIFFSVDLIIRFKNRSVFDSLEDKFSITDIMLENKISEEDFVKCLRDYMIEVYPKIAKGSVYTRKVLPTQYSMMMFSPYQIRTAGKTFERLNKMVLKKI